MQATRPPEPMSERTWRIGLLLMVIGVFLVRARYFGNPLVDVDEAFYLLTGDRMLHGAIPYVDIWDRKPVGLFVLYAAIRLLGGSGIIQYQLVAACFAATTAILIASMARRIATPGAALVAGLSYAPALALSGGQGGQTPVFYNLFVAAAAALVLARIAPRPGGEAIARRLRVHGAGVMLLIGVAIQIKYNALFEGIYLGLALLLLSWRADPRPRSLIGDALAWIAAALAPTLLAYLIYVAIGHAAEFDYAVRSIFSRGSIGRADELHNLRHDLGRVAPYLIAILVATLLRRHAPWRASAGATAAYWFLAGWAGAALAGFLVFGTYFDHYVLPLIPPLAVIAAPAFAIRRWRAGAIAATMLLTVFIGWFTIYARKTDARRGTASHAYDFSARIRPLLKDGGCLFIFYGDPIYYHLTDSCLLTRWPFPFHLSLTREASALGVDPAAEMRRILARKPPVVLDRETDDPEVNPAIHRILLDELHRNYRLTRVFTLSGKDHEQDQLWERISGR